MPLWAGEKLIGCAPGTMGATERQKSGQLGQTKNGKLHFSTVP